MLCLAASATSSATSILENPRYISLAPNLSFDSDQLHSVEQEQMIFVGPIRYLDFNNHRISFARLSMSSEVTARKEVASRWGVGTKPTPSIVQLGPCAFAFACGGAIFASACHNSSFRWLFFGPRLRLGLREFLLYREGILQRICCRASLHRMASSITSLLPLALAIISHANSVVMLRISTSGSSSSRPISMWIRSLFSCVFGVCPTLPYVPCPCSAALVLWLSVGRHGGCQGLALSLRLASSFSSFFS